MYIIGKAVLVNSRLLTVLGESQKLCVDFGCMGVIAPNPHFIQRYTILGNWGDFHKIKLAIGYLWERAADQK